MHSNRNMEVFYSKGTPELAKELYEEILEVAGLFFTAAKTIEIKLLQNHNPSYEELAKMMKRSASIISVIADDFDPFLCEKARNYVDIMHSMSLAINSNNSILLEQGIQELEKLPWV